MAVNKKPFSRYAEKLGLRIKELRDERGLTQEQLAVKSHMSQSYLAQIESGTTNTTLKFMVKISQGLGVNASELLPF
jgi:XRE family aerobic/anaerobic benzoate catabolism transcriptional regulator